MAIRLSLVTWSSLVAGDLLLEEHVVRLVLVERADHVIAVAPGVGTVEVVLEAVGIGVARDIQPVAAPALAIVRRGQQPVDEALPAASRAVVEKFGGLGGRGRQADQIEISAADQRCRVGFGRRFESALLHGLQQERVDGMAVPARVTR